MKPIFVATHPRSCSTAYERVRVVVLYPLEVQSSPLCRAAQLTSLRVLRCL